MIDRLRDPHVRARSAVVMLCITLVGWPLTHVLIILTKPPEASWVFHLLLALSWLALTLTCLDIACTTDVRREQEEEDS